MELEKLIKELRYVALYLPWSEIRKDADEVVGRVVQTLEAQQARIAELEAVRKERDELLTIMKHIAFCEECGHWDAENEMCVCGMPCCAGERWIWRGVTNMDVGEKVERRWIPVGERLPDKDGHYLCKYCLGSNTDMKFTQVLDFYATDAIPHFQHTLGETNMRVTHWMPLPEPPKEGV